MNVHNLRVKIPQNKLKTPEANLERDLFFEKLEYYYEDETPRLHPPCNTPRMLEEVSIARPAKRARVSKKRLFMPYSTVEELCRFLRDD